MTESCNFAFHFPIANQKVVEIKFQNYKKLADFFLKGIPFCSEIFKALIEYSDESIEAF
jgi:hypothetical protein